MNERVDRIVTKLFRFSMKDGKGDYPLSNMVIIRYVVGILYIPLYA